MDKSKIILGVVLIGCGAGVYFLIKKLQANNQASQDAKDLLAKIEAQDKK